MAGDWIKMRAALLDHPKVVAISRVLQRDTRFREWLTPGDGGPMNGKLVSDAASRAVTTALLMRAWSIAREHGKFVGEDLHLPHSTVEDLDQIGGAPGLGVAMHGVGWVEERDGHKGVFLPNFKEFNVPMTEAERAKNYRDRQREAVTEPSRNVRDETAKNVTTRVEKRREEVKPKSNATSVALPDWLPNEAWQAFGEMRAKIRAPLTDKAKTLALAELGKLRDQGHDPRAVLEQSVLRGWRGLFPPKPGEAKPGLPSYT